MFSFWQVDLSVLLRSSVKITWTLFCSIWSICCLHLSTRLPNVLIGCGDSQLVYELSECSQTKAVVGQQLNRLPSVNGLCSGLPAFDRRHRWDSLGTDSIKLSARAPNRWTEGERERVSPHWNRSHFEWTVAQGGHSTLFNRIVIYWLYSQIDVINYLEICSETLTERWMYIPLEYGNQAVHRVPCTKSKSSSPRTAIE